MPVKFAPTTAIPFVRRPLFIILSVFGGIFAIWIIVLCVKTTARIVHRLFKHREEELFDVEAQSCKNLASIEELGDPMELIYTRYDGKPHVLRKVKPAHRALFGKASKPRRTPFKRNVSPLHQVLNADGSVSSPRRSSSTINPRDLRNWIEADTSYGVHAGYGYAHSAHNLAKKAVLERNRPAAAEADTTTNAAANTTSTSVKIEAPLETRALVTSDYKPPLAAGGYQWGSVSYTLGRPIKGKCGSHAAGKENQPLPSRLLD